MAGENGVKYKSFNECPFKITIPNMSVLDGVVKVSFKILSQKGISCEVVLDEIYISDMLDRKYDQYFSEICKGNTKTQKDIIADITIDKKNFLMAGSSLVFFFHVGDGKKYEICYTMSRDKGMVLQYVMHRDLSQEEKEKFNKCISNNLKTSIYAKDVYGNNSVSNINTSNGFIVSEIEKYKNAVLREKYFLQNEGGRKHKVSNGLFISQKGGLYTYSFELESELYLPDDSPITLTVGTNIAKGSVLLCEGFLIIVVIDKDFGNRVLQATIGVEPWKLLEALVKKLDELNSSNELAVKILEEGPGLALDQPATTIPKGQEEAINAFLKNDITVIWGPPGTGKTYTMAQIGMQALKEGKSVLVVSHSNVSVDGVVKQTVAVMKNAGMEKYLVDGKVLRYGYVRDPELAMDSYAVAYNYALNHRPDLQNRILSLNKEKEHLKKTGHYNSLEGDRIEKELKKLRGEIRVEERKYVEKARFVATTISKATIDSLFEEKLFDVVMFDEVSMAYVPQIICAAMYANEKMVLVGDFRQLAPIVQSEVKNVLGNDIFAYLGISNGTDVCAHEWLVMLNEQRRMHKDISAFPNQEVYSNLLVDHPSVKYRDEIASKDPLPGYAMNLVNMSGTFCSAMKNSDNSRFNILSAIISFTTALQAEEKGEKQIAIITPYAAQTRLINAMIHDYKKNKPTNIVCSTVHQFQGSERNIVIFDAVESYPGSKVGYLMGKVLDSVLRLINVAVTRARGKLIVVANTKFWQMKFDNSKHILWKLIKHLISYGNMVAVKNGVLENYVKELPETKTISFFTEIDKVIDQFKIDCDKAKEKIVISLPDGELDSKTQDTVLKIIMKCFSKGIRILCKTSDYEELPDGWKDIAWASENAVFPLIIIDDSVAWYGIPTSKGKFKDGNMTFPTVCHLYYRIVGEHVIEQIKAFSDFEYRVINGQTKPLNEKIGQQISAGSVNKPDSETGFARFVNEMQKCSKCHKPMVLTRGKTGKCYMKCSSCSETSLIQPEFLNSYITREYVRCPIHKCGIFAGLSKFGIYVKCDMGHYLKPDEI